MAACGCADQFIEQIVLSERLVLAVFHRFKRARQELSHVCS
jgi:hypothetical protein